MAFTTQSKFTGDGSRREYPVEFPYLDKDHVEVLQNGVPLVFSWVTDSTIRTAYAPSVGSIIHVRRKTPMDSRLVDYTVGRLRSKDLNDDSNQLLYALQELVDQFRGERFDVDGDLDEDGTNEVINAVVEGVSSSQLYQDLNARLDGLSTISDNTLELVVGEYENVPTLSGLQAQLDALGEGLTTSVAVTQDSISLLRVLEVTGGGAVALVEDEATVRASEDAALAATTSTLQTELDDNTATIQETLTSVDGLEAQYSLKIDVNGYLAGFGLSVYENDDSEHTSDFIIRADRFAIVDPSSGNNVVPFSVENGQVYIDGNLVAEGSISASQMNVVNLSAISANMGSITSGKITSQGGSKRVEIDADSQYPLWFGSGLKTAANGQFYVDRDANAVFGGNLDIKSSSSGARLEIRNDVIKVYDGNGALRVKLGNLNA